MWQCAGIRLSGQRLKEEGQDGIELTSKWQGSKLPDWAEQQLDGRVSAPLSHLSCHCASTDPWPAPLPPISLHCETSLHSLGHLSHSSLLHSHMLHCTHYPAVHCASVESVHLAACIHFAALSLVSSPVALSSACQKIHCIAFSTELHCILLSTELHCFALLNSCWFVYQPLLLPPLHWDQHSLTHF